MNKDPFIEKDGGFTTVGVAVALLLVMALLFSAVQVRWVQSHSADIQFVADAGALAGGNVVGEYLVLARVADAVVLSLSLLGMATYGIAIVVCCIPDMQQVGVKMLEFGQKVFDARDKVADTAAKALDALQAALPFLIALNASAAIEANCSINASYSNYRGLAIPLPITGEETAFPDVGEAAQSATDLDDQNTEAAEHTQAAQIAYEAMELAQQTAYMADCGNNPAYCMYERAAKLAVLSGSRNQYFSSVDTWLFDYAYERAINYYTQRLAREAPKDQSLSEQVQSFCRTRFYTYALQELRAGSCTTLPDGRLIGCFPLLPCNNNEMRQTRLFTERVYPLSADGVLHGSTACPAYAEAGAGGSGSVAELEAGTHQHCPTCGFSAVNIGQVALATTSTASGFEHYYHIVAEQASLYQRAAEEYAHETEAAQESAQRSFDLFEAAMAVLSTPRLKPLPPGHNGVIAIVVDTSAHSIPAGFTNSAVSSSAQVQPRLAIAAAALAEEQADYGANILASFLDRAQAQLESSSSSLALVGLEVFAGILDIWGSALLVYSRGGDAISEGLGTFLDSIPFVRATLLSRWARDALADVVEALGLEGADLDTPRPLLVNTIHVLRASDAAPAAALLGVKEAYTSLGGSGSGTFGEMLVDGFTSALASQATELLEQEFTIYEISFGDMPGLPSIPITLHLPDSAVERGRAVIDSLAGNLNTSLGGGNHAVWE